MIHADSVAFTARLLRAASVDGAEGAAAVLRSVPDALLPVVVMQLATAAARYPELVEQMESTAMELAWRTSPDR